MQPTMALKPLVFALAAVMAMAAQASGDGNGNMGGYGGGYDDGGFKLSAASSSELAGSDTQQVLTRDGWKNAVHSNATVTNFMNGFSGNGGANVSAGAGNQQNNSSSIAASCKACM